MAFNTSKIQKVHALVAQSGGWGSVYSSFPELDRCFAHLGKEYPCPKTGNGKTKFSFFKQNAELSGGAFHRDDGALPDGIEVIAWYENISKSDALNMIIDCLGGDISKITKRDVTNINRQKYRANTETISPEDAKKRLSTRSKVWRDALPIQNTLAETYLRSRGMKGCSSTWHDLYFHPSLSYKENDDTPWTKHPGMLAVVRNTCGTPVTLHRTFLNADGTSKANVTRQKMMLAQPEPLNGACIMIDRPTQTDFGGLIGVSEGIENGLAVREATGCPIWVGISDRIMEKILFWDSISTIVIWEDIEPSGAGHRAALNIREKWHALGKQVIIKDPSTILPRDKVDWLDVYVERQAASFDFHLPHISRIAS
jgi:hypothetical protein